jgi:unsaturated chondroitin disaccharide hydrolase
VEPDTIRDTSATAIAAAALVKLSALVGGQYKQAGKETIDALAGRLTPRGGLGQGCYNAKKQLATDHELIWGDFFALATALALDGTLSTDHL